MNGQALTTGVGVWLVALLLAGCSGYQMKGRVVEGAFDDISLVRPDDARLTEENPVADATLTVTLDPDWPNHKVIGRGRSGADGSFVIDIGEFGAGVLEHEVEVVARRVGYAPSVGRFVLPGSGKRVLVTMPLGEDRRVYEPSFKERTLRDAEPYLRE